MVKLNKLHINVVSLKKLKVLISFNQKVSSQANSRRLGDYTDVELPAESQNLTHLKYVICVKRGKPKFLLTIDR